MHAGGPFLTQVGTRGRSLGTAVALACHRRYSSHGSTHHDSHGGTWRTTASSRYAESKPSTPFSASGTSSTRVESPSYLYRSFMGHSTRFAAMVRPLTHADITQLEREPLTHSTPGRVNDHVCIAMVKALRWLADRAFRERYIHRATMLVTVASAAPAAGSVAAYLRMFFKRRSNGASSTSADGPKMPSAAEARSPFLAFASFSRDGAPTCVRGASSSSLTARRSLHVSPPSATKERAGVTLEHSYVDELRGLLTQCESHAVHYQVLSSMAEITHVERSLVLLLQAVHFILYLMLFLFYPRMAFRLMAYTAEESSVVWTQMVNDIDLGKIAEARVPQLAFHYWGLHGAVTARAAPVPMEGVSKVQRVDICKSSEGQRREEVLVTDTETSDLSRTIADTAHGSSMSSSAPVDHEFAPATVSGTRGDSSLERKGPTGRVFVTSDVAADTGSVVLTLRDVALLIRSDEMVFRDLNHEFTDELDRQPSLLQRLVESFNKER